MKLKYLTLIAAILLLFTSCAKEEIDPVLEIYVTTKASDNWQDANISVSNVRFAQILEDGTPAFSNLQNYFGATYDVGLGSENTKLVYNDSHFDMSKVEGLRLLFGNIFLSNGDEGDASVSTPYFRFVPLNEIASVENGKSYRIDFTIDFDKLIYQENGQFIMDENYEVEIQEL